MSQCLENGSDKANRLTKDERDSCATLDSEVAIRACKAEIGNSTLGLRDRCMQSLKAKCAQINYDDTKIQGCRALGIDVEPDIPLPEPDPAPDVPDPQPPHVVPIPKPKPNENEVNPSPKPTPAKNDPAPQNNPQQQVEAFVDPSPDLQACRSSQSSAARCCGNPAACAGVSTITPNISANGSLKSYCEQLKAATQQNTQANNRAADACYSSYSSCTNTCNQALSKYRSLASRGTSNSSAYQQAVAELESMSSACSSYSSVVSSLGSQGLESMAGNQGADECGMSAASNIPSSPSIAAANKDQLEYAKAQGMMTAINALAQTERAEQGDAGFRTADKKKTDFGLGDTSSTFPMSYGGVDKGPGGDPPTVRPIPNNTGQFTGGGSGLDNLAATSARKTVGGGKSATDVFQDGYVSGGYNYNRAAPVDINDFRPQGARTPASPKEDNGGYFLGMDLKRMLPSWIADRIWKPRAMNASSYAALPVCVPTKTKPCPQRLKEAARVGGNQRIGQIGASEESPTEPGWLFAALITTTLMAVGYLVFVNMRERKKSLG